MNVEVTSVEVGLSQVLRGKCARQVRLALGHLGRSIHRVTVRLSESHDGAGAVDRRCRMRAWLRGGGDVRVDAVDADFETAVASAAAQLGRRLSGGGPARSAGPSRGRDRIGAHQAATRSAAAPAAAGMPGLDRLDAERARSMADEGGVSAVLTEVEPSGAAGARPAQE